MDDRSWMYRDSLEGLRKMNYYNEVQSYINYILSNPRNISGNGVRCPCKRYMNKNFLDPGVVTLHLVQKGFIERYICWFAHRKPYVPHETMVERMIRSTSSFNNAHGVVDDNNNSYRYFLITSRLQMLFMSLKTVKHITWYHSHDVMDGVMVVNPENILNLYDIIDGLNSSVYFKEHWNFSFLN